MTLPGDSSIIITIWSNIITIIIGFISSEYLKKMNFSPAPTAIVMT
jgi:hypothetical protein